MPKRWTQVRDWLLPGGLERDEDFRQEILSASYRGVRVVVGAEVVVALIALAGLMPRQTAVGILLLAAATLGISTLGKTYPYNRLLAGVSSCAASVVAVRSMLSGVSADYALGTSTFLMLAAVTAVPLLPVQCLSIGGIVYLAGLDCGHLLFFGMLALAATCISATLYDQRRLNYRLFMDTLQTSAELREYQSQAMRAESTGTMVRLTAALAHELSSPIGALSSGIATLLVVSARQATSPPEGQQRLLAIQADLRGSLQDSLERLRKIVNRIQRLTNLDEAVTQEANLNELVNEAVGLMKPQIAAGTRFELDLQPIPNVTCRPQRLLAVLCTLLSNSIHAVNGNGCIAISTALRDSQLELKVEDNGHGIAADQLAHIFDPRFQVANGKVSTGNWSLFTSRQYMQEHGGDIRIQSMEGKGTTVCLTLPSTC
ncbi:MAG TPA: HAMP domain-containing sensor histidine kinase [Bryobacteraceae bacterium]